MSPPQLLVAGSIARDRLEGPFGLVEEELGGSALYFALAAGLITDVHLAAPVGGEDLGAVRALLAGRPVHLGGLSPLAAPTYRWRALQVSGANLDLGSHDSIYDAWRPRLPAGFQGWAFVGSMRPDRQLEVATRLCPGAQLLAADAMQSYLAAAPAEARGLLGLVDWYFANEAELAALGGDPADPEGFRLTHRLRGLVIKRGAGGVTAHTEAGQIHVPALAGPVVDTTGAGDSLAGAMLAHWLRSGGEAEGLPAALRHGVAAASIAIQAIGLRSLATATPDSLRERLRSFPL